MVKDVSEIEALRDRLTSLLADWGTEVSCLLHELAENRERLRQHAEESSGRDAELDELRQRTEAAERLVDALREDAEDSTRLRAEVRDRDLEIERMKSELESKQELVRALRRDVEGRASDELAEIETLRTELEARKALIRSLRADADRVDVLETRLEEKRSIMRELEASLNQNAETIAELRRNVEHWKAEARGLTGTRAAPLETATLGDTDIAVVQSLEAQADLETDHTIAIDMREPLREARRKAGEG